MALALAAPTPSQALCRAVGIPMAPTGRPLQSAEQVFDYLFAYQGLNFGPVAHSILFASSSEANS
jgi:hypothetical protein